MSRAEWEAEASDIYIESEGVWAEAYKELQNKRSAWESEILAKFSKGGEEWQVSGEQ